MVTTGQFPWPCVILGYTGNLDHFVEADLMQINQNVLYKRVASPWNQHCSRGWKVGVSRISCECTLFKSGVTSVLEQHWLCHLKKVISYIFVQWKLKLDGLFWNCSLCYQKIIMIHLKILFKHFIFLWVHTCLSECDMWRPGMAPGSQLAPSRVGAGDWSVFRLGSKDLLDGPSRWPLEKNLFLLCLEHNELTGLSWLRDLRTPSQTWR